METSVRMRKYAINSVERGIKFRNLADIDRGDARWENGSLMRRRKRGNIITMFDNDKWMRNDMASRDAEDFPRWRKCETSGILNEARKVLPPQANIRDIRSRVFSNDEVDSASEGRNR